MINSTIDTFKIPQKEGAGQKLNFYLMIVRLAYGL